MPAPALAPAFRLTLDEARLVFAAAQGFPPPPGRTIVEALEETGFVRTLGGVDIYIAVRARVPGLRRQDLDLVVGKHEAQIVPAVRGCMYLVPRRDVPLCLRVAERLSRARDERDREKAGIRPGEVEEVSQEVIKTLEARGPLTTDSLRRALPAGVVRSLGEQGKKVGVSSPLPAALRLLEFQGRVERTLENVRLDSERYLWRAAAHSPFEGTPLPDDPIDLYAGIARIFFRAAGLGSQKELAAWAGIPQKDAKAAMERADLLPVAIEGVADMHYLPAERRDLPAASKEAAASVAFLPFEDNLVALHGGPTLLVDAAHHAVQVPVWGGGKDTTLGGARHMSIRSFLADGKIAGFWEFDPDARTVVYAPFGALSAAARKKMVAAADDFTRFLAEDVGHGRSFSLDTDDELRTRSAQVRGMQARA